MSALSVRPLKVAVFGFSGLMLAAVALAIARKRVSSKPPQKSAAWV